MEMNRMSGTGACPDYEVAAYAIVDRHGALNRNTTSIHRHAAMVFPFLPLR